MAWEPRRTKQKTLESFAGNRSRRVSSRPVAREGHHLVLSRGWYGRPRGPSRFKARILSTFQFQCTHTLADAQPAGPAMRVIGPQSSIAPRVCGDSMTHAADCRFLQTRVAFCGGRPGVWRPCTVAEFAISAARIRSQRLCRFGTADAQGRSSLGAAASSIFNPAAGRKAEEMHHGCRHRVRRRADRRRTVPPVS